MCPPMLMPWPLNLPYFTAVVLETPSLLLGPGFALGAAHGLVEVAALRRGRPPNRAGWMLPATAALVASVVAVLWEQSTLLVAPNPLSPEIVAPMVRFVAATPIGLTVGLLLAGISASVSAFDPRARPHAARLATVGATLLTLLALVEVLRGRVLLWWLHERHELVAVPGILRWTDGARAALVSGLVVLAAVGLLRGGGAATWTSTGLRLLRGAAVLAMGLGWQAGLSRISGGPAHLLGADCVQVTNLHARAPFPCRARPRAVIEAQIVSSARMPPPP